MPKMNASILFSINCVLSLIGMDKPSDSNTPIPLIKITPPTPTQQQRSTHKKSPVLPQQPCNQFKMAIRSKSAVLIKLCIYDAYVEKSIEDLDAALTFARESNNESLANLLILAGATNKIADATNS